jgi:Zn ribbon nucleic-acid-binding protein
MPEISSRPTRTPSITFGPCPKCQNQMRLALIEPDLAVKPEFETRTYQCDACGHAETKTVKYR